MKRKISCYHQISKKRKTFDQGILTHELNFINVNKNLSKIFNSKIFQNLIKIDNLIIQITGKTFLDEIQTPKLDNVELKDFDLAKTEVANILVKKNKKYVMLIALNLSVAYALLLSDQKKYYYSVNERTLIDVLLLLRCFNYGYDRVNRDYNLNLEYFNKDDLKLVCKNE